ncbi:MAG: LPS assembly lipoprotein LptE [Thiofilum sp.]|uniref:LPS-assembly lipoprotein LptE n=1 Tax=Thiofilum sp. TaxID=2212733 RepID=UPI0025DCCFF8|nr:LPS assembly lipoprotein LptE [Thiofilum sp.]MBK8454681.1 hypothetical protein [Thiofilum sp.]
MLKRKTLMTGLVWAWLTLILSACGGETGFHLRGSDPIAMQSLKVAVEGENNTEFGSLVRSVLQARGAVLSDATTAEILLTLQAPLESRRVSGYSATRAVSAFRYTTEASFSLKRQGTAQVLTDSVAQSQVQAYDSEYVLGTQEEADQIKSNLRREVARLLALKVVAFQRNL